MFRLLLSAICVCTLAASAGAQSREEKVRNDKKAVEAKGYWIYNDLPKAFADAKTSKKPLVVVLRCIPCEECVKLDDDLIDADERLKPLLEKFVRVRVVSTNGLDLSLFQFDTDQSFAVFFLNADGTVYGRFGTRSHRKDWVGDVSVDGLAKALSGALDLHKEYPKNKDTLKAKRGPEPKYATPEKYPTLKDRYKADLDYKGKVVPSCIHCHQIGDAEKSIALAAKEPISDVVLYPYPHPKTLGLILDPKECATVAKVEADSLAAKAGFAEGDRIKTLGGQPLLSIADVQWVLHGTPAEGGKLKASIVRKGKDSEVTLDLPKGWRQREDVSWRASTWQLRRVALGGALLTSMKDEDRKKLDVPKGAMALSVQHVGQYAPHDVAHRAGLRKGDVLTAFNGKSDLLRETDVIAHSLRQLKRGEKISLTILRDGKKQTLTMTLPK